LISDNIGEMPPFGVTAFSTDPVTPNVTPKLPQMSRNQEGPPRTHK
jgi:hypothetical protein